MKRYAIITRSEDGRGYMNAQGWSCDRWTDASTFPSLLAAHRVLAGVRRERIENQCFETLYASVKPVTARQFKRTLASRPPLTRKQRIKRMRRYYEFEREMYRYEAEMNEAQSMR